MLCLHVSNRTENLLRHLVEIIRVSGRRGPFEKEMFLIQSQGMERIINQTLAENFTSWCNFVYYLPLRFLQHVAAGLDMPVTPDGYDREVLAWRIEHLLRDLEGGEYHSLHRYLRGANLALKRYQLADRLANVFDQYQLMRPEMLAAWERGETVTTNPTETWQRALWRRLAADSGGVPHRGVLLQQVIGRLRSREDLSGRLPRRLSVFGLTIMPPLFLAFLQGVARHSEVHLYVLSPCRNYWGDSESRKRLVREALRAGTPADADLDLPESHPLLVSLGRQGRDFQRLLFDDQVNFELEIPSYEDPSDTDKPTLLHRLQSDLLQGEVTPEQKKWSADDHSIRIVSCHSRLREITVLREHILRLLHDDPELQLRDMVVMAPDIQEYSALIPAVFSDIQHSIADRSLRRRNSILAAFGAFIDLLRRGRFGWDEVLDLLKEPAVAAKFALTASDLENIRHWVVASGVRWGLSAEQRGEMGLPTLAETTWRAGLERLLMGYATAGEDFVCDILPFADIEGSGAAPLGALCRFIDLLDQAREQIRGGRTLAGWSELLQGYSEELFGGTVLADAGGDFTELQEILIELGSKPGRFHTGEIDFTVIAAWLEHTARETRSSSGFLRGQLTFCSMLPMRSIPFKTVCLIGLGDGEFPKNDRRATFDLLAESVRPGDRSRRMDERYLFLEALLAARENLYLSYVGQSIKTNEEIPPSVVIAELLEVLREAYRAEDLVVRHPLHPFSSSYFSGASPGLFSYNAHACEVADRLRQPPDEEPDWWGVRNGGVVGEIAIADLFRFFSHPQRYFVRDCLGIRLDTDMDLVSESEPFQTEGLENYLLNQYLLNETMNGSDPATTRRRLRIEGRWPLGVPGDLAFAARTEELQTFAEEVAAAGMGRRLEDRRVELEVAGYRLTGSLANIHEGGILLYRYATFKGKDLLSAWLHHLLFKQLTGAAAPTALLCRDGLKKISETDSPQPDLETMVALFVDGCRRPSPLFVEPAAAWLNKAEKGAGMLAAARASLADSLERGFEPETALLLRDTTVEAVLGEEFERLCRDVLQPIWRAADAG